MNLMNVKSEDEARDRAEELIAIKSGYVISSKVIQQEKKILKSFLQTLKTWIWSVLRL